ncbi:zinc-binding dehydrogenase [Nocardia fusca]|uniref:zinc-binding dehydrogenase n=1 Tax=Nocardia fusca TaxID=941183 RepID=UPI00379BFC3F
MHTVRAAVFEAPGKPLTLQEITPSDPGPGEVTIRMTAAGICHSDASALTGAIPLPPGALHVLGHEGAGIVTAVGSGVRTVSEGDTVVVAGVASCGVCWHCLRGEGALCEEAATPSPHRALTTAGDEVYGFGGVGVFAEAATVSASSVTALKTTLPASQLALLGCALLTALGAVTNSGQIQVGDTVVVLGCGGVGQATVQIARVAGAAFIIAIDPVASKREAALKAGATHAVDPGEDDPVEQVRALTGGRGANVVIEVVGRAETQQQAWSMAARGGRVVAVGYPDPTSTITLHGMEVVGSARSLIGSFFGLTNPHADLPRLVALAEAGRIDLGALVTRTIALEDINGAFTEMEHGQVIRSVIDFAS